MKTLRRGLVLAGLTLCVACTGCDEDDDANLAWLPAQAGFAGIGSDSSTILIVPITSTGTTSGGSTP